MITPAQARELVDHFGSIRAAARGVGVTHPTVRRWLDPSVIERDRARFRVWYDRQSGVEYNRRLLYIRRRKALYRRQERSTREGE